MWTKKTDEGLQCDSINMLARTERQYLRLSTSNRVLNKSENRGLYPCLTATQEASTDETFVKVVIACLETCATVSREASVVVVLWWWLSKGFEA